MTIRTRMAFTVILFLVGCALATPYLRNSTETASSGGAANSTTPTLQIQRSFSPENLDVGSNFYRPVGVATAAAPAASSPADDAYQTDRGAPIRTDQTRAIVTPEPQSPNFGAITATSKSPRTTNNITAMPTQPFPKLQMPPPLEVHRDRLQRVGSQPVSQQVTALKPVRLPSETETVNTTVWTTKRLESLDNEIPKPVPRRIDGHADRPRLESIPQLNSQAVGSVTNNRVDSAFTATPESRQTTLHRIVNGDTLADISKTYYGSPEYALVIFNANRNELVSPDILPIGKELVIPNKPSPKRDVTRASVQPIQPSIVNDDMAHISQDGWRRATNRGF